MPFKLHDKIRRTGNTVVLSLGSRAFRQEELFTPTAGSGVSNFFRN